MEQIGHIDEIHVELGREMKNPADKRKKLTLQIQENENTNLRIKALLTEFANPEFEIENVRPHSPSQQDLLHIYEEEVLNESAKNMPEDIATILKNSMRQMQKNVRLLLMYYATNAGWNRNIAHLIREP